MRTTVRDGEAAQLRSSVEAGIRRDTLVALAGLWLLGGLYLDGWAHVHVPALETFFSPWRAVLYGGFLLLAVSIVTPALLGWRQGLAWRAATPAGYGLAILGVALFGTGGLLDLGWHSLFGIESDTEALLAFRPARSAISPPHLLLATGAGLMVSTPLRSAWRRGDAPQRWITWLAPLLSLVQLLALLGFFTSYAHPFAQTAAARSERHTGVDQWSAHLTFGAVALAALAGWLVSYLVFAPPSET